MAHSRRCASRWLAGCDALLSTQGLWTALAAQKAAGACRKSLSRGAIELSAPQDTGQSFRGSYDNAPGQMMQCSETVHVACMKTRAPSCLMHAACQLQ